jgi:hypothetical protein
MKRLPYEEIKRGEQLEAFYPKGPPLSISLFPIRPTVKLLLKQYK